MTIDLQPFIALGWLAVAGGLLNAIGDWFLLGFPVAGREIKMELIAKKPARAVRFGVYIAMLAIPLWLCVLIPLAFLLRDAPPMLQGVTLIATALCVIFSLVYHITYVFYDIAYRHFPDSVEAVLREKKRLQLFVMSAGIVMCSALLAAGVLGGAPVWWLVANPFVTQALLTTLARFVPAPLGGYLLTGGGSLGFAVFAAVTMIATP